MIFHLVLIFTWTLCANGIRNYGTSAQLFNHKQDALKTCPECETTDLPAFVSRPVVRIVLSDVGVYSIQCKLLVWSHRDRLDY